ncbi:hypothetical protein D3C76_1402890 [compost metagenome]
MIACLPPGYRQRCDGALQALQGQQIMQAQDGVGLVQRRHETVSAIACAEPADRCGISRGIAGAQLQLLLQQNAEGAVLPVQQPGQPLQRRKRAFLAAEA